MLENNSNLVRFRKKEKLTISLKLAESENVGL